MNRKAVMMNFPQASSPSSIVWSEELDKNRTASKAKGKVRIITIRRIFGDIAKSVQVGPGAKSAMDLLMETDSEK